jgi:hypothetical protein
MQNHKMIDISCVCAQQSGGHFSLEPDDGSRTSFCCGMKSSGLWTVSIVVTHSYVSLYIIALVLFLWHCHFIHEIYSDTNNIFLLPNE